MHLPTVQHARVPIQSQTGTAQSGSARWRPCTLSPSASKPPTGLTRRSGQRSPRQTAWTERVAHLGECSLPLALHPLPRPDSSAHQDRPTPPRALRFRERYVTHQWSRRPPPAQAETENITHLQRCSPPLTLNSLHLTDNSPHTNCSVPPHASPHRECTLLITLHSLPLPENAPLPNCTVPPSPDAHHRQEMGATLA